MNTRIGAVTVAAAFALAACRDTSDLEAHMVAQQKANCASKGKQFVWHDTDTEQNPWMVTVRVEGRCVGPGEKGYEPPAPADSDS